MKKYFVITVLMIASCMIIYAEEPDELDSRLFRELKAEHKLTDAQTYELLGLTYLQEGDSERAAIYFNEAVSLDPILYLSWYNLGLLNMDMDDPEYYFEEAIEVNPEFSPPYYWLASYYCKAKKKTESIKYFEEYLKVADKDDPQEKDRIEMAGYFIKEMKAGNDDYNSIIEKALSGK